MDPLERLRTQDPQPTPEKPAERPVVKRHGPATPVYEIPMPQSMDLRPERPMEAARWLGAGFGLAIMVLTVLGLVWIVASGVGTGRWVWEPAPRSSATPRPSTPTPLSEALPTLSPDPDVSPSPTPSGTAGRGTIKGEVGFPAGSAPDQTVCAELTTNTSRRYCVDVTPATSGSLAYSLSAPAGTYHVYARLKSAQGDFTTSYRAYYNQYVTCGLAASCADALQDQKIPVTVSVGATVAGVDPTDWYNLP